MAQANRMKKASPRRARGEFQAILLRPGVDAPGWAGEESSAFAAFDRAEMGSTKRYCVAGFHPLAQLGFLALGKRTHFGARRNLEFLSRRAPPEPPPGEIRTSARGAACDQCDSLPSFAGKKLPAAIRQAETARSSSASGCSSLFSISFGQT